MEDFWRHVWANVWWYLTIFFSFLMGRYPALWRATSGHFITDVEIRLKADRNYCDEADDHLVTQIWLAKGARSALTLLSLQVEVFVLPRESFGAGVDSALKHSSKSKTSKYITAAEPVFIPEPTNRSLNARGNKICTQQVFAFWTHHMGRPENLGPGEKTQYESYCLVPKDGVYEVNVTLMGERYKAYFFRKLARSFSWILGHMWLSESKTPTVAYWTASTISLPKILRQPQSAILQTTRAT